MVEKNSEWQEGDPAFWSEWNGRMNGVSSQRETSPGWYMCVHVHAHENPLPIGCLAISFKPQL